MKPLEGFAFSFDAFSAAWDVVNIIRQGEPLKGTSLDERTHLVASQQSLTGVGKGCSGASR